MEPALAIILFLAFLFGSAILVLVFGFKAKAEERGESLDELFAPSLAPVDIPRFLAEPRPLAEARMTGDRWLVDRVQEYLLEERQLAAAFVAAPSVEGLYGVRDREIPDTESLVERVERFVKREWALASEFVAEPSVGSLLSQSEPQVSYGYAALPRA